MPQIAPLMHFPGSQISCQETAETPANTALQLPEPILTSSREDAVLGIEHAICMEAKFRFFKIMMAHGTLNDARHMESQKAGSGVTSDEPSATRASLSLLRGLSLSSGIIPTATKQSIVDAAITLDLLPHPRSGVIEQHCVWVGNCLNAGARGQIQHAPVHGQCPAAAGAHAVTCRCLRAHWSCVGEHISSEKACTWKCLASHERPLSPSMAAVLPHTSSGFPVCRVCPLSSWYLC